MGNLYNFTMSYNLKRAILLVTILANDTKS